MRPDPIRLYVELSPEQVEQIAERAAELVASRLPRQDQPRSPYFTVPEAAEYLRTKRQRIDDLLSLGRLTRVKDGGRTLIARAEIEAYVRAGARRGLPALRRAA